MIPMIDWLSCTLDITEYDNKMILNLLKLNRAKLEAIELRAKFSQKGSFIEMGGELFQIMPNGAAGYAYIMHHKLFEIRLAHYRSKNPNNYPVYIHLKSEMLWSLGWDGAWKWITSWINRHIGPIVASKLNRIDLCCHTDHFKFTRNDVDRFKGRYRNDTTSINRSYRACNGFGIGSRGSHSIYCRIYNKSLEVKTKRTKMWFHEIWKKNKLPIDNVWNIEFELHRDTIKEMKIGEGIDNHGIGDVDSFLSHVHDVWDYLTKEWLVMTDDSAKRLERCKPTVEWAKIQQAFETYPSGGHITRKKQHDAQIEPLLDSAMGYLTSYAMLAGTETPEESIRSLLTEGLERYEEKGKDFKAEVSKKKKLNNLQGA